MIRLAVALLAFFCAPAVVHAQALEGTLKKIRDSKTITIAYRTDALPFSFEENQQPSGYTVELCKRVVASIEQQLKTRPLQVKWVAATSQNRIELVRKGEVNMECGSTTATLSRMEQVDFSHPVFVDTTGLLVRRSSGASSLGGLGGRKIAVVGATTNQKALENALASDKILLGGLVGKVKDPSLYGMLADDLGFEPYAIVLPRGDASFRLAVNRALAQIYGSGAIVEVFRRAFGPQSQPSPALALMYELNTYPD